MPCRICGGLIAQPAGKRGRPRTRHIECLKPKGRIPSKGLRNRSGWTEIRYSLAVIEQQGLCAICGQEPDGRGIQAILHADHNHRTGHPRALLCGRCNTILGMARDDPTILLAAAEYLERFNRDDPMLWD